MKSGRMINKYQRKVVTILLILLLCIIFVKPPAEYKISSIRDLLPDDTSILPSCLIEISEEAFLGTALSSIAFNDSLTYIGSFAFYNIRDLISVYIPDSVVNIGLHAFSSNIDIYGVCDSYVESWARSNGYHFTAKDIWNVGTPQIVHIIKLLSSLLLCPLVPNCEYKYRRRRIKRYIRSMRPQDRPELLPINYRFP